MHSLSTALYTVALLLVLSPGLARGQTPDADERARFHFQAGASHYATGNYEAALREFQRSHELSGRPQLFYNMALAYERLGEVSRAIQALRRYLGEAQDIPDRPLVERKLARLQTGAGEDDAGARRGSDSEAESADTGSAYVASDTEHAPSRGGVPTTALIAFGVAAIGGTVFAVAGLSALAVDADLSERCGDEGCPRETIADDIDKERRLSLVADVGLAVAVAGGVLGAVLWLTHRDRPEGDTPRAALQVTPWLDPRGQLGAAAQMRF